MCLCFSTRDELEGMMDPFLARLNTVLSQALEASGVCWCGAGWGDSQTAFCALNFAFAHGKIKRDWDF
jgi:hypothetical protein